MSEENKEIKLESPSELLSEIKSATELVMFFDPLEISTENLAEDVNIQFNKSEFIKGLTDSSYFAGLYTGLMNSAFSQEDAIALIFNKMNIENNIRVSEISANASIEVSKHVANVKDHSEL